MTTKQKVKNTIFASLKSLLPEASVQFDMDTPLGEGGLELDSLAYLDIILAIEEKLDVRARTEDLDADALLSVGSLVHFVESLCDGNS